MNNRAIFRLLVLLSAVILHPSSFILSAAPAGDPDWHELVAAGQLVEVRKIDPSILVEMRYATPHNCVGAALYPADFPCLARPETAVRLHLAQTFLHEWGYRLKIWDAYRPLTAHQKLWQKIAKHGYVADPEKGPGSLHSWGLAVDVTMVDLVGHEVSMPSDFDVFTPNASAIYQGNDTKAAFHLRLLQAAMYAAGFFGLSTEWWHFTVRDWNHSKPLATMAEPRSPGKVSDGKGKNGTPPIPLEEGNAPVGADGRKPETNAAGR